MAAGNGSGFEAGTPSETLTGAWANADSVLLTAGDAVIIDTDSAHGDQSVEFTGTASAGYSCFYKTIAPTDTIALVVYVKLIALPSSDVTILWVGDGGSQRAHVELATTGAIRFRDDTNSARWDGVSTTSPGTLPLNQWVRIELALERDASAGTFHLAAYGYDDTTPLTDMDSGVVTDQNTGSSSYTQIRVGAKSSTSSATITMRVDDWDYDPASTTFIGPYVSTLTTPAVTVGTVTNPSTIGGSDGAVEVSWPAVPDAVSYDALAAPGSSPSQGDFVLVEAGVTSPYVFTGLEAGTQSFGIQAKAS